MNISSQETTIIKLNPQHDETWRYPGRIISRESNSILVEAFFNRADLTFHGIMLRENDRFIERYYADRWYNIFQIHDREDDRLKAWYCNVTTPAEIGIDTITYIDLALDLLVYPTGDYLILDEDEFTSLNIDPETRLIARQALNDLIAIAESGGMVQCIEGTTL